MKKRQALWASSHDWYVSHYYDIVRGYVVIGQDRGIDGAVGRIETADYQALRNWAGY